MSLVGSYNKCHNHVVDSRFSLDSFAVCGAVMGGVLLSTVGLDLCASILIDGKSPRLVVQSEPRLRSRPFEALPHDEIAQLRQEKLFS